MDISKKDLEIVVKAKMKQSLELAKEAEKIKQEAIELYLTLESIN